MLEAGLAAALVADGDSTDWLSKFSIAAHPHAQIRCAAVAGIDQVRIVVQVALVLELRMDAAAVPGLP